MHATLEAIKAELEQSIAALNSKLPSNEPMNIAHNNWSFPGITRDELVNRTSDLIQLIDARGSDNLETNEALLEDYPRRLSFLHRSTIPNLWSNPGAGVPNYLATLDGLKHALEPAFSGVELEAIAAAKTLKRLMGQIRGIEARVTALGPRSQGLDAKVERIEEAHDAADQLPTDLATLEESRNKVAELLRVATEDREKIGAFVIDATSNNSALQKSELQAKAIIERCDAAYRATTSEGLASAFADRAKVLNLSMWVWVAGLIVALAAGAIFGSSQVTALSKMISDPSRAQDGAVWINLLMTLLSIGGPIWFAWIATKQIGQRFRLAEDYSYKASISKAYEGYRREAEMLDPAFQHRLFSSALLRLDEIPLRLVETDTPGSPWHELVSSDAVRDAIATVPGFAQSVTDLAKAALARFSRGSKPMQTSTRSSVPDESGTVKQEG